MDATANRASAQACGPDQAQPRLQARRDHVGGRCGRAVLAGLGHSRSHAPPLSHCRAAELGEVGGSLAEALRRGADPCMGPAAWESLSAGEAGAALLRSLVCRCPEGAPLDVTLAAPGPEVPAAVALMRVLAEAAPQAAEGRAVRLRVRELGVENPAAGPPHPAHIQLRLGPADEQCSVPGRNDGGADPFRALVDVGALCCIHRRLSSQARRIAFAATAHSLGRAMADEESLAAAVLARSRAAPPAVWTDAAGAALRFDAAYALHHGLVGLVPGPMRRHFEQEALLPACAVPAGEGEVSARDGERSWVRIKPGKAEWTRISGLVRSSMVLSALFPRKGAEERAEPPAPSADEPVPQGASSAHQTLRGGDLRRVARRSVLARAGYGALGGGRLAIPLPRHHWFPRRLASWAATGAGAEGSGDTAYGASQRVVPSLGRGCSPTNLPFYLPSFLPSLAADAALSMAARLERVARQRGEWSTVWDLQRDFPHAPQALGGQVPAGAGAVALCGQVRALCMRRRSVVVVEMRLTPTAHHASTLLELSRGEDRGPGGSEGPRVLVAFTIHCEPKWDGEWDPAVGTEAAGVAGTLPLLKALENGLRGGDLLLVRGAVRPQGKVAAWHPDAIVVAADSIALVGVESPFSPDGETWQLDLTHPCLGHQVATATASA